MAKTGVLVLDLADLRLLVIVKEVVPSIVKDGISLLSDEGLKVDSLI